MMPELSKETESAIIALMARYPQERAALIPALHLAQKQVGYLPESVQARVGELLGLPLPQVREVVSFYTMFRTAPIGKCHLQVCRTLSCAMRGSRTIIHKLEETLHIRPGQTTSDGLFTLSTAECLASCGTAPVMRVDEEFVENLDWQKVQAVIDRVRSGSGK